MLPAKASAFAGGPCGTRPRTPASGPSSNASANPYIDVSSEPTSQDRARGPRAVLAQRRPGRDAEETAGRDAEVRGVPGSHELFVSPARECLAVRDAGEEADQQHEGAVEDHAGRSRLVHAKPLASS